MSAARYPAGNCKNCGHPVQHIPGGYCHTNTYATHCGENGGDRTYASPDYSTAR